MKKNKKNRASLRRKRNVKLPWILAGAITVTLVGLGGAYGNGSIGNHLAYSFIHFKNTVEVVDVDNSSLARMKNDIYPSRYKKWNSRIKLTLFKNDNNFNNDYYVIGTPPNTRIEILKKILLSKDKPKGILIEKPITTFDKKNINEISYLIRQLENKKIFVFCGYNHSISEAFNRFIKIVNVNKSKKNLLSIESNWNETMKIDPKKFKEVNESQIKEHIERLKRKLSNLKYSKKRDYKKLGEGLSFSDSFNHLEILSITGFENYSKDLCDKLGVSPSS